MRGSPKLWLSWTCLDVWTFQHFFPYLQSHSSSIRSIAHSPLYSSSRWCNCHTWETLGCLPRCEIAESYTGSSTGWGIQGLGDCELCKSAPISSLNSRHQGMSYIVWNPGSGGSQRKCKRLPTNTLMRAIFGSSNGHDLIRGTKEESASDYIEAETPTPAFKY